MSFIVVIKYVMLGSGLLRALQARIGQEFGSVNDVRPCIQLQTMYSFPNTAGFSIHRLVRKLCHRDLQDP